MGSFSSILWENVMFQFRISFWQKKIKWKYFDIVRIVIYLLRYLQIGARLIPFVRRKVEHFEINFWQKKGHSKLAPERLFFKGLNATRFKSNLSASSMFLFYLKSKTATFYWIERVFVKFLKLSLCGITSICHRGANR